MSHILLTAPQRDKGDNLTEAAKRLSSLSHMHHFTVDQEMGRTVPLMGISGEEEDRARISENIRCQ